MEIPTQTVLEGIIAMMEQVVLPELTAKYTRGQAMAGIVLLKGLVTRLERQEGIEFEELDLLRATFEEIVCRLQKAEGLQKDETLAKLQGKIKEALLRGDIQKEIGVLYTLLEETISILAEAEKRHSGSALEALKQIRKTIRGHLRKQFKIQGRLSNPLEMKQLSKAQ